MSDTPMTDERTYPADAMGKTLVVHAEWAKQLDRENAALRADKERLLDLLEGCVYFADNSEGIVGWHFDGEVFPWGEIEVIQEARAAIDAARKETK